MQRNLTRRRWSPGRGSRHPSYDAIVELVTNSDDRYQILGAPGRVEIELGRRGRGRSSILRVRDFADGMTTEQMSLRQSESAWGSARAPARW